MKRRDALKRTALIMGYAVSATAMAGVLNGCNVDTTTPEKIWKPQFFSAPQMKNLTEAVERILPKTATPGAKDMMVHRFIDEMMHSIYKPEESKAFAAGLDKMEANAQAAHQKSFADLEDAQKDALLTTLMNEGKTESDNNPGAKIPPFFNSLKELTFLGFFTSEKIGEEVFAYDPVPGRYDGCIPLEGNAWAY